MFYFDTLPKILTPDENGNFILMTNLLARAKLVEELRNNPMIFYEYAIQDGDTPEIIAEKYYGDPYQYWIILLSNEILNPVWDWPLNYEEFLLYIDAKYATEAESEDQTPFEYTNTNIHHYEKIITIRNDDGEKETIVIVNQQQYNSLVESDTTYVVAGQTVNVKIEKKAVTIFDYENELNEDKRQIKIMNSSFVGDFQARFSSLMEIR
jgi:hypothetical protein